MKMLISSALCVQIYFRMLLTFPSLQDSLCNYSLSSAMQKLHDPVQVRQNQAGC